MVFNLTMLNYDPIQKVITFLQFMFFTQGSHSDGKTWKTWKNGKAFSSQGKVRENHTKYWKNLGISDKYYLLSLVIFK